MYKLLLLSFLAGFLCRPCTAQRDLQKAIDQRLQHQKRVMDSLRHEIARANADTTKIRLYLALCEECEVSENIEFTRPALALVEKGLRAGRDTAAARLLMSRKGRLLWMEHYYYADKEGNLSVNMKERLEQSLASFEKAGDLQGMVDASLSLADMYFRQGESLRQLSVLQEGLAAMKRRGYDKGSSRFLVGLQQMYASLGDTAQAIAYLEEAWKLEKKINDPTRVARGTFLTGHSYYLLGKNEEAVEYFQKAISLYRKKNDAQPMGNVYTRLGEAYVDMGQAAPALAAFDSATTWAARTNDIFVMFRCLLGKSKAYSLQKDYAQALSLLHYALGLAKGYGEDAPVAIVSGLLAEVYFKSGDFRQAAMYADASIRLTVNMEAVKAVAEKEKLAYRIDSALGNAHGALSHFRKYVGLRDKLHSEEVQKAASRDRFKREYEKQALLDRTEQERKDAIAREERETQRVILYAVCGGLFLLILLAGYIFKSYREKARANRELQLKNTIITEQKLLVEEKHKEIRDSINYAERIQRSFLASKDLLGRHLKDSFVLFLPKEAVSGDFYWASVLANGNFLLVTADSTGHGVPGAIMSILNITCLENAVREGLTDPAAILGHTRASIIARLKMDGSSDGGKDGMDCSVLCFDFSRGSASYAGANNPVWIVRGEEVIELSPDKMPAGRHDKDHLAFSRQDIDLRSGDVIYMFTDGYADQFGGPRGKKFMYRQLKDTLLQIRNESMQRQQEILRQVLLDWKGSAEQVDDITVIGMRV
jgi:serine phosphatase RsbU (regulator of sigma subunit)